MECLNSNHAIAVIVDGADSEQYSQEMTEHVCACEACSTAVNDHRRIRQHVRTLPMRQSSAYLQKSLRSLAQRDRNRRLRWLRLAQAYNTWRLRMRLMLTEMMQPMALPVAGGVISALMLFGALMPDMF